MASAFILVRKQFLRSLKRFELSHLSPTDRKKKSRKIIDKVLQCPVYIKAKNIFIYCSLPQEVQTKYLILDALKKNKNVFLPKVDMRNHKIEIFPIRDIKLSLKKGAYGIPEPKTMSKKGKPEDLNLVIAPGLAFDRKGNRLGRGGGYFDRFLKKTKHAKKIGICFSEQMVRDIPKEIHDIAVDKVISD